MRYLTRALAIFFFFSAAILFAPDIALTASASISVTPQADGSVPATATGSFASCTVCAARDALGNCTQTTTVNNGSIWLFRDSSPLLCGASGNGSASCTRIEDRGGLNGTHVYNATATDCTGSASSSFTLILDNTPTVTVTNPTGVVSGPFDVAGNATFKPALSVVKGSISGFINGVLIATKTCLTESCVFSYQELAGRLRDMAHGGPYTVRLVATGGGATASDEKTFTVDNMPTVAVTNPIGVISGPFDVTGDATFKPALSVLKGTIGGFINGTLIATKSCLTESCVFSYQELAGRLFSLAVGGPYTARLVATGGGATASDQKTFTVATCRDNDGDGFFGYDPVSCPQGNDCNDNDPAINPDADEKCTREDANCNTEIAENACSCKTDEGFESSFNVATGNLSHSQALFSTKGTGLTTSISLHYNALESHTGPLGIGWIHSYDIALRETSNGSVILRQGDGKKRLYNLSTDGYVPRPGNYATLTKEASGWKLVEKSGAIYRFDQDGKIVDIADRNANTMTFSYTTGVLTSVVDSSGRVTTFDYDAQQRIIASTEPNGNVHSFSYLGDSLASVSTQDSQLGTRTWSYTYDANALLLTKIDPNGNTTTYVHDSNHGVVGATTPEGKVKTVTYNPTTSTTQVMESDGGVWTYRYDTRVGVLTQKTDPQGNTTLYTYDTNKNLTSRTDPDGAVTRYTYDSQGNMTTMTDAIGQTTSYTYNSFGQVTSTTGPQGDVTVPTYDAKGNLISTTDPSGAVTSYEYDAKGNITRLTDAQGRITTFGYDPQGNLGFITDPTGATTTFTYDISGNRTSQTDAQGNITTFEYDSLGQLVKTTDPSGNVTAYSYDGNGNRASQTDANGNLTEYAYNSKGQLTAVEDALGQMTNYAYDGASCPTCGGGGNSLTEVTDANGRVTHYHYDASGRLVEEADPLGNSLSYTYDAKGNLIAKIDANGARTQYAYDALGRLIQKSYLDNSTEFFTYDAKGNILTAANQNISYAFSYDVNSRVTSVTDSNGRTISYQYDALGNRTQVTYPDGSVVSYGYDTVGRLASLTHAGRTFAYQYDSLGRRTGITFPNGAVGSYAYDSSARLTSLSHTASTGASIQSFAYTHDNVGNRKTKVDHNGAFSYTYDTLYRLTEAINPLPSNPVETYAYDVVGNRTNSNQNGLSSFNVANQLLEDGKFTYQYDNNGNLTRKSAKSGTKVTLYDYDFENRLIRVEIQEADKTTLVTFTYDPFGRRLSKTVHRQEIEDDEGEGEGPGTTTYVYDNEDIILEVLTKVEDGQTKTETTRFTHGPGIDEPLAVEKKKEIYFYHADGLGSVVALTDSEQKAVESYDYDSFGNFKHKGGKVKNTYTFTGREWDKEIGLYFYRARYYDSSSGRFIQSDPIGLAGGLNLYQYANCNPVSKTDPLGLTTYMCQQPLHAFGGTGVRSGPDIPGNPLYHQFFCVSDGKGGYICGGQDREGSAFFPGSPGKPSNDKWPSNADQACQIKDDRQCVDQCVIRKISDPKRPWYAIGPLGTDCQEWADKALRECRKECSGR